MNRKTTGWTIDGEGNTIKATGFDVIVRAETKTEATRELLKYAKMALTEAPRLKIKNNAWQLAYWSLGVVTVESGTTESEGALCLAGEHDMQSVKPESASFEYYASEDYRNNR